MRITAVLCFLLATSLPAQSPTGQGIRAFEARRYAEARAAFGTAAKADDAVAMQYLGRLELLEGDAGSAVKWLERAVKRNARSAEAHRWLGRAYARQARRAGKLKQARLAGRVREAFETAVKLAPDDVAARRDLLQFYLVAPRIVGGGHDKAEAQARALAARSPMQGRLAAAWIAEAKGDLARARREIDAAVERWPAEPAPALALGALQQRAKQWSEAVATYQRVLARDPGAREALYQLGRAAAMSGVAVDAGAAALEKFVATSPGEEDPPLASGWLRLGSIRERQGAAETARRAYREAVRLDPGLDDAKRALARLGD